MSKVHHFVFESDLFIALDVRHLPNCLVSRIINM